MAAAPTASTAAALSLSSVPENRTRERGRSSSSIRPTSCRVQSQPPEADRIGATVPLAGGLFTHVSGQLQTYRETVGITADLIEEAAHRFALLGDPTRLRLLQALMDHTELSVGDVSAATGTSRFNASAHLNRLAHAG